MQPLSGEQRPDTATPEGSAALEPLQRLQPEELLVDRAYRELSRAIITGRLERGTPLSVPELAGRLNISRSPVREAVQRLIYEGLAEKRGRRGVTVACIEQDDLMALLQVRILLDGLAARLAAEEASDADIAKLRDILQRHRDFVAAGDPDQVTRIGLDLEFHAAIRDAVGSKDLNALLRRVHARTHLSYAADYRQHKPLDPLADHEAIVEAIAARDPDAAETAAKRHVSAVRDSYVPDPTPPATAAVRDRESSA